MKTKVIEPIADQYPNVKFEIDVFRESQSYYQDVRFQIFACDKKGTEYFLIDGGFTDWTQQLLSSKKERLLTSGLGSERLLVCFSQ